MLAEADEIFQGGKPYLTVVDGRTFLVLNLEPADSRTADDWGITFLAFSERGLRFQDVVSDGARGIRAGVEAAELGVPSKLDLFHLLRQGQAITRRLERSAYEAIETTDRIRRAVREQTGGKRRRGRPLSVSLSLEEAQAAEHKAVVPMIFGAGCCGKFVAVWSRSRPPTSSPLRPRPAAPSRQPLS